MSIDEAVKAQKAVLGRMMLATPQHLELRREYVHSGALPSTAYQTPWRRAKPFAAKEASVDALLSKLQDDSSVGNREVEPFESKGIIIHEHAGSTFEVVPSSNPLSQDSLDDEMLLRLCEHEGTWETFDKHDILTQVSLNENDKLLEEVESTHALHKYLDKKPSAQDLLHRLKPKAVSDPLLKADGTPYTEKGVFVQEDQSIEAEVFHVVNDEEFWKSEFPKENLVTYQALEEMEGELLEPGGSGVEHIGDSGSLQALLEEVTPQPVSPLPDFKNCGDDLTKDSDLAAGVEELHVSPLGKEIIDFTAINDTSPQTNLHHREDNMLLESPVVESNTVVQGQLDLHPWESVEPLDVAAGDPITEGGILSEASQKRIEEEIWHREKQLNEILVLTLPEPKIERTQIEAKSGEKLVSQLGLKREELSGSLELELPWDPLHHSPARKVDFCESYVTEGLDDKDTSAAEDYETFYIPYDDREEKLEMVGDSLFHTKSTLRELTAVPSVRHTFQENKNISIEKKRIEKTCSPIVPRDTVLLPTKLGYDPIADFMFLRQMSSKTMRADGKNGNKGRPEKSPLISETASGNINEATPPKPNHRHGGPEEPGIFPSSDPSSPANKKPRSKVMVRKIDMTDAFTELLSSIAHSAEPLLDVLRAHGVAPPSKRFSQLTPDGARFILKQFEKSQEPGATGGEVHEAVASVYTLACVADSVQHACLHAALLQLAALTHKYSLQHSGTLSKLHKAMLVVHDTHRRTHVAHPKVTEMLCFMTEWMARKRHKSPQHDLKMLVVCRSQSVSEHVHEHVATLPDVTPRCLPASATHSHIIHSLELCNCVVWTGEALPEDFPWSQFSLVVEYDLAHNHQIKEHCERQNIRYVGLQCTPWSDQKTSVNNPITAATAQVNEKETVSEPIILVASQHVTSQPHLLRLLESKYDLRPQLVCFLDRVVVRRLVLSNLSAFDGLLFDTIPLYQLTVLEKNTSRIQQLNPHLQFADIAFDERSGMLLVAMEMVAKGDAAIKALMERIRALSYKYEHCWVLLFSPDADRRYWYSDKYISNVSKRIETSCTTSDPPYDVKVEHTYGLMGTAAQIRHLAEHARDHSSMVPPHEWTQRSWLTPAISQQEKQLLSVPCINVFRCYLQLNVYERIVAAVVNVQLNKFGESAQMLLSLRPFNELRVMSAEQLTSLCPRIPLRILKMFHELVIKPHESLTESKQSEMTSQTLPPASVSQQRSLKESGSRLSTNAPVRPKERNIKHCCKDNSYSKKELDYIRFDREQVNDTTEAQFGEEAEWYHPDYKSPLTRDNDQSLEDICLPAQIPDSQIQSVPEMADFDHLITMPLTPSDRLSQAKINQYEMAILEHEFTVKSDEHKPPCLSFDKVNNEHKTTNELDGIKNELLYRSTSARKRLLYRPSRVATPVPHRLDVMSSDFSNSNLIQNDKENYNSNHSNVATTPYVYTPAQPFQRPNSFTIQQMKQKQDLRRETSYESMDPSIPDVCLSPMQYLERKCTASDTDVETRVSKLDKFLDLSSVPPQSRNLAMPRLGNVENTANTYNPRRYDVLRSETVHRSDNEASVYRGSLREPTASLPNNQLRERQPTQPNIENIYGLPVRRNEVREQVQPVVKTGNLYEDQSGNRSVIHALVREHEHKCNAHLGVSKSRNSESTLPVGSIATRTGNDSTLRHKMNIAQRVMELEAKPGDGTVGASIRHLPPPKGQRNPAMVCALKHQTASLWSEFGQLQSKAARVRREEELADKLTKTRAEKDEVRQQILSNRELSAGIPPYPHGSASQYRPHTPCVAAVTPRVRPALATACAPRDESPPMDYDSDTGLEWSRGQSRGGSSYQMHVAQDQRAVSTQQRRPPAGARAPVGMRARFTRTHTAQQPEMVHTTYTPSKKRKLTYEKIPGVKSGQTKLSFR